MIVGLGSTHNCENEGMPHKFSLKWAKMLYTAAFVAVVWPGESAMAVDCESWASREFFQDADINLLNNCSLRDLKDGYGRAPIHYVAEANSSEEVVKWFLDNGANPYLGDDDGWTPLHVAAASGSEEVAKILLDNGANPYRADDDGWTPLHVAAASGSEGVAEILLGNGANPHALASDGWTPSDLAKWRGNGDIEAIRFQP